jgi:hypothetical protein
VVSKHKTEALHAVHYRHFIDSQPTKITGALFYEKNDKNPALYLGLLINSFVQTSLSDQQYQ